MITKPLLDEEKERFTKDDVVWIKSKWYCKDCGKQDVWQRSNEHEDYYTGANAYCHSCNEQMSCLPVIATNKDYQFSE